MQALSDGQHIAAIEAKVDKLEKKVDDGFAAMRTEAQAMRAQILSSERALRGEIVGARSDARADFRTLIGVVFAMWAATVLAVIGVLAAHL
ncbi:MAG: hypothetical protein JSU06_12200 [Actinobacteria bacterium]|nr:hypothetical protein [Actinomycetota bacterium]